MLFFFLPWSNKPDSDPLGLGCLVFVVIVVLIGGLLSVLSMSGIICYRYYASVDVVQAEHNYIRHSFELPVLLKGSPDGDIEQYEDGCQYIRSNVYWQDRHGYALMDKSEYILLEEHKDEIKTPFERPSIRLYAEKLNFDFYE